MKQKSEQGGFPREATTKHVRVPDYVIFTGRLLKHVEFRVLVTLAMYNPCHPSYERLMELTGITNRNTLAAAIRALVSKKMVTVRKIKAGQYYNNEYTITHPKTWKHVQKVVRMSDSKTKESSKGISK
jgi:hypothetical protein